MAKKFILQPWENTCICGRSISDGGTYLRDPWIVSIYEEFEYQKARFPLCLGALISHHHVLTSKMCFGRLEIENGKEKFVFKWPKNKVKEMLSSGSWKVMLGAKESYPYLEDGAFPHSTALDIDHSQLERHGILLRDVVELKHNIHDHFVILTMKDYVAFKGNIRSLCLPENPNQFYGQGEYKVAEIHGFAYNSDIREALSVFSAKENAWGKMLRTSRTLTMLRAKIVSREDCQHKLGTTLRM